MEKLELRMFGLVPYNISPIQQGIQFGHSTDEMSLAEIEKLLSGGTIDERFLDWLRNWKTYIILNGGTTNKQRNSTGEPFGTLNQHLLSLIRNGVAVTTFTEEDLGDQLTGITFIVDERVFNTEKYPDFKGYVVQRYSESFWEISISDMERCGGNYTPETWFRNLYADWKLSVGGDKNIFLREFLEPFKLA